MTEQTKKTTGNHLIDYTIGAKTHDGLIANGVTPTQNTLMPKKGDTIENGNIGCDIKLSKIYGSCAAIPRLEELAFIKEVKEYQEWLKNGDIYVDKETQQAFYHNGYPNYDTVSAPSLSVESLAVLEQANKDIKSVSPATQIAYNTVMNNLSLFSIEATNHSNMIGYENGTLDFTTKI